MQDVSFEEAASPGDGVAAELPGGLVPSPEVRAAGSEHVVLLDLASGQYFMLNGTGARVWRCLERGIPLERAVDELADELEASRSEVRREVLELVEYLSNEGLVRPGSATSGGPDATAAPKPQPVPRRAVPATSPEAEPRSRVPFLHWFRAWWVLVYVDLLASARGFPRLLAALPACPSGDGSSREGDAAAATIDRTVAAVDRAASLYFRKAWCLARSAACTWLLRRRSIPAQLVLGVRPLPFYAHAWVEVGGEVVNDDEWVCRLDVLDRF